MAPLTDSDSLRFEMPWTSYIRPKCSTVYISQPAFLQRSLLPRLDHHISESYSSPSIQSIFVAAFALAMAKGAAIALLFSALVLLALASQVEAQCKTIDASDLSPCVMSIQKGGCDAGCKSALQPYAAQSPECICQLVAQALAIGAKIGVQKKDITNLIMNCGQAPPNCR